MSHFETMFKIQKHQPARLLLVPGLNNSGPAHWQTWLQSLHRTSVRVEQEDWLTPDLDRWALCIGETLDRAGQGPWLVAAHSFGTLALARLTVLRPDLKLDGALLVAPADPEKFGVLAQLPQSRLRFSSVLVGSQNDPWMSSARARAWALLWGSHWLNLGEAGHINAEAGFGPWPFAQRWVVSGAQRLVRERRQATADLAEWSIAA